MKHLDQGVTLGSQNLLRDSDRSPGEVDLPGMIHVPCPDDLGRKVRQENICEPTKLIEDLFLNFRVVNVGFHYVHIREWYRTDRLDVHPEHQTLWTNNLSRNLQPSAWRASKVDHSLPFPDQIVSLGRLFELVSCSTSISLDLGKAIVLVPLTFLNPSARSLEASNGG